MQAHDQGDNLPPGGAAGPRPTRRNSGRPGMFGGLSGKLLWLTVVCIMLAEVLIFFPSVASMRLRWLDERLNAAAAAAIVIDGLQPVELPRALQKETLEATGTKAIVLRKDGTSRLLATTDMPTSVDEQYDLTDVPAGDGDPRRARYADLRRQPHDPRLRPGAGHQYRRRSGDEGQALCARRCSFIPATSFCCRS